MFRLISRKLHTALEPKFGKGFSTAVVIVDKDSKPPRWSLKEPGLEDFKNTKLVWAYPKTKLYNRCVVLKVTKEDDVYSSACKAIAGLKARKIENADVLFPRKFKQQDVEKWTNTAILKNYTFSAKTSAKEEDSKETFVNSLNLDFKKKIIQEDFNQSVLSAKNAIYARDLANTRGSEGNPTFLAEKAQEIYNLNPDKLKIKVLKGEELKAEGLNLLYSVGQAATNPPYLVVLEYQGHPESEEKLSLVGKGLTYDTGGLNLKPTNSIETMYLDKSGACAALATLKWAVETSYKINIVCTLAIAENAIGSKSYKPLDIITSKKGLTVEIGNTDAEGRLCLADALTYTQTNYKPQTIIDLATLTGAVVVALGEETAGVFGNDKNLLKNIENAGKYYQEPVWELPITSEHETSVKGKTADITNSGKSRYGGASQGAAFLKHFIEPNVKWAHLDIAGPAMNKADRGQFSAGGTGFGVQLLTRYIKENY